MFEAPSVYFQCVNERAAHVKIECVSRQCPPGPMDGRFGHGRFGQDVLATDVLATYIEKTDVLAKSIIYVLIIDIKATNIFNLLI